MEKINYEEAIEELEQIVSDIENEGISVDELSEKVKRAAKLIRLCKTKLYKTEEEVNKVLQEITPSDNNVEE